MGSVKMELASPNKPCKNYAMNIINEKDSIETEYWEHMDKVQLHVYNLSLNSDEAIQILNLIADKAANYGSYKITKIERVQNPFLMAMYLLAKEELIEEYGHKKVKSKLLLHGTKAKNVESIIHDNFDLTMIKRNRYGEGIYFTDDIMYASKFSYGGFTNKKLIVTYVLQSGLCAGSEDMSVPDDGTDTSYTKTKHDQNVFVKYDDDTFYPAYIVTFKVSY